MSVAVGSVRGHVARPPPAPRLGGRHPGPRGAARSSRAWRTWARRCRTSCSSSSTSRPPAAPPADSGDHRDRRGQGARRRGPRRVPDPGATRAAPSPPFIQVLTGITTTMLVGAPPIEAGAAQLPGVLAAAPSSSRTTPPSTSGSSRPPPRAPATPGRATRWWTPSGSPAAWSPATRPRTTSSPRSPALFHATVTPEPPGAVATPAPRSTSCTRCCPGSAPLGITHLEDLATATDPVPRGRAAASAPSPTGCRTAPGVYLFRGPGDEVLYVGTSTTSLRQRVRSYFTSAEKRSRMIEMVRVAHRVDPIPCATPLEARVRELRLIAAHSPRYNRRSRFPERMPWVRLTSEPYPACPWCARSRTRTAPTYIGPFSSARTAQLAVDALHETFPIRQCTRRLPLIAPAGASAPACSRRWASAARPALGTRAVGRLRRCRRGASAHAMLADATPVVEAHADRIALARRAGAVRGGRGPCATGSAAFLRGASRAQRFAPLAGLCGARSRARRGRRRWLGARAGALRPARRDRTRRPADRPQARHRRPCRPRASRSRRPVAARPGGAPRGDRPDAGLAREARRAPGRGRPPVGVPRAVGGGARRPGHAVDDAGQAATRPEGGRLIQLVPPRRARASWTSPRPDRCARDRRRAGHPDQHPAPRTA